MIARLAVRIFAVLVAATTLQGFTAAFTLGEDQSFVIARSEVAKNVLSRSKRHISGSSIKSLHVTSVIMSRFARVTFASKMENDENFAKEMVFSVRLPKAAFITEFDMVVDGVKFKGVVKEKEIAKDQYENAVKKGHSAGLVVADVRETRTFDVSANVPAQSGVSFHLVYQQLLERKLGQYEHVIMVNPTQPIDDFVVDVYITEESGITEVSVGSSDAADMKAELRRSRSQAKISFKPTATDLRRFLALSEDKQKFTVRYDVSREVLGGEMKTRNGYFVHFFAPEDLPILPKRVIFVIDTSGSMAGKEIEQTKTAFTSIIRELRDSDKFNILAFASGVRMWRNAINGVVDVTQQNVQDAVAYVNEIITGGMTNLNQAVTDAANLLNRIPEEENTAFSIILLTDGMPTAGVTDTSQIRRNAHRTINGRFSLFCLGFGDDVNQDFLGRLAKENDGIARKIYEDSDADLQLKGFFEEVATPLLLHVRMNYSGKNITEVSHSSFEKYFRGSEKIIVGSYSEDQQSSSIQSIIKGESGNGVFVHTVTSSEIDDSFQHWYKDTGEFDDFIERLWAYFTINKLLEKISLSEDRVEKQDITNRVLTLSLKYKFVTPLTSIVVTLPEDGETSPDPSQTTVKPPSLCYELGVPIPDNTVRPPIACPVILNTVLAKKTATSPVKHSYRMYSRSRSPPSDSGRVAHFFSQSSIGRSFSPRHGSSQRIIGSAVLRRHHSRNLRRPSQPQRAGIQRTQFRIQGMRDSTTTAPTLPPTRESVSRRNCHRTLKDSSGKFQLPEKNQRRTKKCTRKIVLGQNSWIDLYIDTANTTENKVLVTSDRKTVFEHNGGESRPQYIPVQHNKLKLVFTVYATDNVLPGIEISYREFVPDAEQSAAIPSSGQIEPVMTEVNCEYIISSSQRLNGVIESPNYPEVYPDDTYCLWNLVDDIGDNRLQLSFVGIDIEYSANGTCTYDKLTVTSSEGDHVFCGFDTPEDIVITDGSTKIKFLTDGALGANGFQLRYDFVPV